MQPLASLPIALTFTPIPTSSNKFSVDQNTDFENVQNCSPITYFTLHNEIQKTKTITSLYEIKMRSRNIIIIISFALFPVNETSLEF